MKKVLVLLAIVGGASAAFAAGPVGSNQVYATYAEAAANCYVPGGATIAPVYNQNMQLVGYECVASFGPGGNG